MKTFVSLLLAFTTLISASNALALNNLSDALFIQDQSRYCAESDDKDKKKTTEGEGDEEEEPDCD